MAAVVYSTPYKLYQNPTTITGTTGTLITGIAENDITLVQDVEVRRRRTGVGAKAGFRIRKGRTLAWSLVIQLRNQSAAGLKLQFSQASTDGTALRPTGGTSTLDFAKTPTFALIARPVLTTEKYVYSPYWSADEGVISQVVMSEIRSQFDGNILILTATLPTNAYTNSPACEFGTSAELAAAFGITE